LSLFTSFDGLILPPNLVSGFIRPLQTGSLGVTRSLISGGDLMTFLAS